LPDVIRDFGEFTNIFCNRTKNIFECMAMFYVMLHTLQLQGNVLAEGGVGVFEDILENTYSCRYIFHWHTAVFKWQFFIVPITERLAPNMQNEDVVRLQQRLKNWEYYDGK